MNDTAGVFIVYIPLIFILFILGLIMPKVSRKDIHFGVQLNDSLGSGSDVRKFYRDYVRLYVYICGSFSIMSILIVATKVFNILFPYFILAVLLLWTFIYYSIHKKVLGYKRINEKIEASKKVIVVDTRFRNDSIRKLLPSPWWFCIPAAVIIINIVSGFIVYDHLPLIVPTHWNSAGRVDGGCLKTYGVIFILPVIQSFITVFLFLIYKVAGWSKQQISAEEPETSVGKNRLFRYRWGAYFIALSTALVLENTIINFHILQIIRLNTLIIILLSPVSMLLIFTSVITMAFWTGQGGSRVKIRKEKFNSGKSLNKDEDRFWKAGLIYFNPQDPTLFIEKRFGIGWGLNYGRFEAYIVIGAVIGSIFLIDYIIKILGSVI